MCRCDGVWMYVIQWLEFLQCAAVDSIELKCTYLSVWTVRYTKRWCAIILCHVSNFSSVVYVVNHIYVQTNETKYPPATTFFFFLSHSFSWSTSVIQSMEYRYTHTQTTCSSLWSIAIDCYWLWQLKFVIYHDQIIWCRLRYTFCIAHVTQLRFLCNELNWEWVCVCAPVFWRKFHILCKWN